MLQMWSLYVTGTGEYVGGKRLVIPVLQHLYMI